MKRPSRLVLIQGAAVLLLVGCAVLFATKLATLSQAVQSRHCAEQIQRLQQQLQRLDHELEGLQPFPGVLKEDYQHAQQSALQRLAALETSARAVDSVASNVTTINTQVQDLEATLLTLKAAGEKCPLACAATTEPARTPAPSSRKTRAKSPALRQPGPPPFTLIGLESRAGESFLAVIPQGLQRLAEVHLLRPGMRLQGWQLTALDSTKAAWLKPDGAVATLSIP
ncbi:hypothetical protein SAMN05216598_4553 [Pseudomonas asplenii]|uniref:Uncharacterized protein n=1 Tax=Pseudomonas asplenii TaxID=53407 RepID=A0A1H1YPB3_9PSED|nr:hypothetical protein [Pseudomonas asplenii]SDT23303.1 hypothetical protein SAMN05216598_4553 [Pseudomonas asplenii]